MTQPSEVVALFRSFSGLKESPPGSNRQRFGVWYGMNGVPWCAISASYVLYACGIRFGDATTAKGFSYCPDIVNWGKKHKRISRTPHVGDLAVAVDGSRAHHVEIVTLVQKTSFTSIGGNTGPADLSNGGEVLEHTHPRGSDWVFVTPPYDKKPVHVAPRPAPTPKHRINRNIGLSTPFTTGPDVKWAQDRLRQLGYYDGRSDGVYGPKSHDAVVDFQKHVGLVRDGVLGPITGDHLAMGR